MWVAETTAMDIIMAPKGGHIVIGVSVQIIFADG